MTWRDFSIYTTAYDINQCREWEKYRLVAHTIYLMNTGDKKKVPIDKFYPLPTDVKKVEKALSKEELEKLKQRFSK